LRATWPLAHDAFLGALRYDRLAAPCLFDGSINGECFRAYVEQFLLPALKPGDVVIMDNLGSHKSAALLRILSAAGARLWYLPLLARPQFDRADLRKDQALDAHRLKTFH
jgi:transposase